MLNGLAVVDERHAHGVQLGRHNAMWGELVTVRGGSVRVMAGACAWLVSNGQAAWLAPGVAHRLRMHVPAGDTVRLRRVTVPGAVCGARPGGSCGLRVGALLGALVGELAEIGEVIADDGYHQAVGVAFVAALGRAEASGFWLDMPRDRHAVAVAEAILNDPAGAARGAALVKTLVARSGVSLRTIQRRFLDETGMGLAEWRRQARMFAGAARLMDGGSVSEAAAMAGFARVGAFSQAFRARFGEVPRGFGASA